MPNSSLIGRRFDALFLHWCEACEHVWMGDVMSVCPLLAMHPYILFFREDLEED